VRIKGLQSQSQFNGHTGVVCGELNQNGRWPVDLDNDKISSDTLLVLPTNLELLPSSSAATIAADAKFHSGPTSATPPPIASVPAHVLPTSTKFSLEALQARGAETACCDTSRLHEYLSKKDFHRVFGMTATDFAKMPGWKQADAKKKHRLF
jgi:hypothetical protein